MTSNKNAAAATLSNPAYDKKRGKTKFKKEPHCMYFYYVDPNLPAVGDQIQHYYFTNDNKVIKELDVPNIIARLVRNARSTQDDPPQCGAGDKYFVWTRKSYIAFVVADSGFSFDSQDAFSFYDNGSPNHTFFDAFDGKMTIDGQDFAVCYCINHLKRDGNANDIGSETAPVRFRLKGNPLPFVGGRRMRLPDSGGTNQGPGVPPPE